MKIGIPALESLLKDGFPPRYIVLLKGPPGIGKEAIGYFMLYNALKQGYPCFYVFYGRTKEELQEEFEKFGLQIKKFKDMYWIDAANLSKNGNVLPCDIENLFTVSLAIKKLLNKFKNKLVFGVVDILSPALMINEPPIIYRFFENLIVTLKQYNTITVFLLEEGVHRQDVVFALESLSNCVIEMKRQEKNFKIENYIVVKKFEGRLVPQKFYKFEITKNGIKIK